MEIKKGIVVSELLEIKRQMDETWVKRKQFCSCTKGVPATFISVSSDFFLIQEQCKNEGN